MLQQRSLFPATPYDKLHPPPCAFSNYPQLLLLLLLALPLQLPMLLLVLPLGLTW